MTHRLTLLLVALLALVSAASAQKLVVRDFHPRPDDLTANTSGTIRTDQNGQPAALVKINTILDDLTFGGTNMGVVHAEQHPGQWWLYIPARSQRISIHHPRYGTVEYYYESPVEQARTYEMQLTFEGRVVALETSVPGSVIEVDGEVLGTSPQNLYLSYGLHPARSRNGNMVFDGNINVTPDGDGRIMLRMEDERNRWGDVTVTVDGNADIYFDGRKVAVGSWSAMLPAGDYVVETRAVNADPQSTSFTVRAQSRDTIAALPPVPHVGYLKLQLKPDDMSVADGSRQLGGDLTSLTLGVGTHELTFSRPGYHTQQRTYNVRRDVEIIDDVTLRQVLFVKPTTVYVNAGFTYAGKPGVSVGLGAVISNLDVSAAYTFGFGESDEVYWWEGSPSEPDDKVYDSRCTYKVNTLAVRLGYQLRLSPKTAVTPTLGYIAQILSTDGERGKGLMCGSLGIGVKGLWVPVQHFGVYLHPEYAVPIQKNDLGTQIASAAGITRGGFMITAGLSFNF